MQKSVNHILGKIKKFAIRHKISTIFIVLVVLGGGYYMHKKSVAAAGETRYVLARVEKGALIASISGSGQVSTSNQIDLKPKVSGDVIYIGVVNGQTVESGALVAELDATDAEKTVRDAQANLQSAQIALQKLTAPADTLSTIQTQNALVQTKSSLEKSYEDGYTAVSDTFLEMPTVVAGLENVLNGTDVSHGNQSNISAYTDMITTYDNSAIALRDNVISKYILAKAAYDKNFSDYKTSSREDGTDKTDAIIAETYDITRNISDTVKNVSDFLSFVKEKLTDHSMPIPAQLLSTQTTLSTYIGEVNSHLQSLLDAKTTITNSNATLAEKTETLNKLLRGADPLDISSSNLSVTQRQNALQDAEDNLAKYYIRAPFAGTIAKINVKKADSVSSGAAAATLITNQKLAEISLNEVDVAKVNINDKATLTFDAIPDLSISGKVAEIDTIGTQSQGVVTYTVKISFDTQNSRIKPGMSVSAAIITDVKTDTLTVPNSAVKSSGNNSYVEILPGSTASAIGPAGITSTVSPENVPVEAGISNDTSTEIVSGLKEGDIIISRTISGTATTQASAPSLFGSFGGGNRSGIGNGMRRLGQ